MRRKALLAVALAVMLALAGCGGTGETTTTQTQTTQTTSQTTTQPQVNYPPGLSADGVESGFDLTDAHAQIIQENGYTVTQLVSINYLNGSSYESYSQTTEWTDSEVFVTRGYNSVSNSTEYDSINAWTNRSVVVFKRSTPGTQASNVTRVDGGVGQISIVQGPTAWSESLYTYIASGDMQVSQDGEDFLLTAPGNITITTEAYGDVTATTLEATVSPDGLIKSVNVEFRTTIDGQTVVVSRTILFATGATVDKPDWV